MLLAAVNDGLELQGRKPPLADDGTWDVEVVGDRGREGGGEGRILNDRVGVVPSCFETRGSVRPVDGALLDIELLFVSSVLVLLGPPKLLESLPLLNRLLLLLLNSKLLLRRCRLLVGLSLIRIKSFGDEVSDRRDNV